MGLYLAQKGAKAAVGRARAVLAACRPGHGSGHELLEQPASASSSAPATSSLGQGEEILLRLRVGSGDEASGSPVEGAHPNRGNVGALAWQPALAVSFPHAMGAVPPPGSFGGPRRIGSFLECECIGGLRYPRIAVHRRGVAAKPHHVRCVASEAKAEASGDGSEKHADGDDDGSGSALSRYILPAVVLLLIGKAILDSVGKACVSNAVQLCRSKGSFFRRTGADRLRYIAMVYPAWVQQAGGIQVLSELIRLQQDVDAGAGADGDEVLVLGCALRALSVLLKDPECLRAAKEDGALKQRLRALAQLWSASTTLRSDANEILETLLDAQEASSS
mmetsp:Transcript_5848/g.14996  ORF Transcript_5848/g.14996 Transcript_5848/m.14996 type:complete len:334 (-) Transcript_5848:71-1072(-)